MSAVTIIPAEKQNADCLLSWTARLDYAVDASRIIIGNQSNTVRETTWIIRAPEITVLNDDDNLIDEKDYYKFNNKLLVLMDAGAQAEPYEKEKERAADITRYIARYRIKEDECLRRIVPDQIKPVARGLIAQIQDRKPDFNSLEIEIAASTAQIEAPISPLLCENQPFKTTWGPSGLNPAVQ